MCMYIYMHIYISIYLSIFSYIYVSIYVSIYVFILMYMYIHPGATPQVARGSVSTPGAPAYGLKGYLAYKKTHSPKTL